VSGALGVESLLSQALERERDCDWLGAVESYEKALGLVPGMDSLKMGQVQERVGYAFYRAAMQAESVDEFRERMRQAVASYGKAREIYGRLSERGKTARMLRCDAFIAYLGYWLASVVSEKKRRLDDCWRLTKESLKALQEVGDTLEYGKTYNQLSTCACFGFCLDWDFKAREKIIREAVEHGEQAIKFLSVNGDPGELARTYAKTAFYLGVLNYYFLDIDEKLKEKGQKALQYWQKANELSEDVAWFELLYPIFGGQIALWGEATDETFANLKKALEHGRKMRDKFVVGCALDWLTYHTAWSGAAIEDPDKRTEIYQKAVQYAEGAKRQYFPISFTSPRSDAVWLETAQAEYHNALAFYETDLRKKRSLLEKARESAQEGPKRAQDSGYPETIIHAHHVLGMILVRLAEIETTSERKKALLEEALGHRIEAIRITEQLEPFLYWNRGIMKGTMALIKYELAELAKEPHNKAKMLEEAISDSESSLKLCTAEIPLFGGSNVYFSPLGFWQYRVGVWWKRLYELTNNTEHLRKAVVDFADAAESYRRVNLKSRIAECHWKSAQVYDDLGEHLKASESFDLASDDYKSAAEKISQLKDFYLDHALYMQAWSEIETARNHHERQEYGLAKEHFEKAADLHRSLKQLSYLAPNYSAWACVEYAEDLSRKEQSEAATTAFEQAAKLFDETKKSLETQVIKIEDADEKQMASNMLKATDLRHEYCEARIAIEQAKILDKKGDHYFSSKRYGSAVETLEKITQALESERERREFQFITTLSRAWQKMTLAEAESSPLLYVEASQLFEEAKESSPNEKTKMLVLGHSRFCRALEAGTRFADSRDTTIHSVAVQHLASAANYYVKADFQNASEYAKATKLLFDAYLQMDKAEKEDDPEKKAKLYAMVEKVLQTSAGSYAKAEHPEKMQQALKLLEKVKEERELAISLTEVLHAPPIISSTTALTTPTPTREEAVGSERFEHADIQANVIARQKELKVGENLDLEIELVNAGKGPAILIKLAEVIPEGFELTERPETYRVEDSYLNMKGKRLDPLKTEEVRLILKPKVQGIFPLKPRILYLDENGKYKSHEPEPTTITVKELGIKGWLKGER